MAIRVIYRTLKDEHLRREPQEYFRRPGRSLLMNPDNTVQNIAESCGKVAARLVESISRTSQLAAGTTPELQQLFERWLSIVAGEILRDAGENSVLNILYQGVSKGYYPPLIFLGIGAMTDFSTMLSKPKLVLLGAAAQIGIFITFIGALLLGFPTNEAASIGIIGGADGPTAIFLTGNRSLSAWEKMAYI